MRGMYGAIMLRREQVPLHQNSENSLKTNSGTRTLRVVCSLNSRCLGNTHEPQIWRRVMSHCVRGETVCVRAKREGIVSDTMRERSERKLGNAVTVVIRKYTTAAAQLNK